MSTPADQAPVAGNPRRKRALIGIALGVLVVAIAYGAYWYLHARWFESTDNAYVSGDIVQLTPQVGGTVLQVAVNDTDFVEAGQTLVKLDPADAKVELDQADAALGQTVREVRTLYSNNASFAAQVALRQADAVRAQADVARAHSDVERRQALTSTGAVSKEELEHARTDEKAMQSALVAAQAAVTAAKEQLLANQALSDGTTVEQHPNVLKAAAHVREAWLAATRAEIVAPVTGYVARKSVQLGQRVQAGTPLMAIIPLGSVWVDANFKESQLASMRIGQPVKLRADVYGSKAEYTGHVVGLGAGTGAAFALLPAQNATGNWIKVVQRVPVRIALDPEQLREHPLRVGLSMDAEVDMHDTSGSMLATAPRPNQGPVVSSSLPQSDDPEAEARVARIISANAGRKPVKTALK
ncbi:HlyD family efflux transporter periplasmic adaptor subunit [soil metagenome]